MNNTVCVLAFTLGCFISGDAVSAATPTTLAREHTTVLRLGQLAVLRMPSNMGRRYLRSGADGAWRDVLTLVKRSGRNVTFRAVGPGKGVIVVSPDVAAGECISCVTIHYFIEVVSRK